MDVLDINNDGYDDLVVGAPQYFKSRDGFEVGGAVFAFISGEDSPLGSGLKNFLEKIAFLIFQT